MSTVRKKLYSREEYLALERAATTRSEYLNGEIFAMAGGTRRHCRIAANLVARTDEQLRETPCEVFGSDMRVKISTSGLYTYPDVTIACGELLFDDRAGDTLLNPRVIFEILSDTTEAYDRGKKFDHYRQIPSLMEYVLVSQDEALVERFVRQADGAWSLTVFRGCEAVLELESVGCRLSLADTYFKVSFDSDEESSAEGGDDLSRNRGASYEGSPGGSAGRRATRPERRYERQRQQPQRRQRLTRAVEIGRAHV